MFTKLYLQVKFWFTDHTQIFRKLFWSVSQAIRIVYTTVATYNFLFTFWVSSSSITAHFSRKTSWADFRNTRKTILTSKRSVSQSRFKAPFFHKQKRHIQFCAEISVYLIVFEKLDSKFFNHQHQKSIAFTDYGLSTKERAQRHFQLLKNRLRSFNSFKDKYSDPLTNFPTLFCSLQHFLSVSHIFSWTWEYSAEICGRALKKLKQIWIVRSALTHKKIQKHHLTIYATCKPPFLRTLESFNAVIFIVLSQIHYHLGGYEPRTLLFEERYVQLKGAQFYN